jgi:hypothetical protein
VIICLARCELGLNEMKEMWWPLSPVWTRRLIRFLGPGTICSLMDRIVKQLAGDSQWFIRLAAQMGQRNWVIMVSPRLVADGVSFPGLALRANTEEAIAEADRLLGSPNPRVVVYPAGGASYPCPPARNGTSENNGAS